MTPDQRKYNIVSILMLLMALVYPTYSAVGSTLANFPEQLVWENTCPDFPQVYPFYDPYPNMDYQVQCFDSSLPTWTPISTFTPELTATDTAVVTETPIVTDTNTPEPTATDTPTPEVTPTDTNTPTVEPVAGDRFVDVSDYLAYWPLGFKPDGNRLGSGLRVSAHSRGVGQQVWDWGMRCLGGALPSQAPWCINYPGQGYLDRTDSFLLTGNVWFDQMPEWESFVRANINNYDVMLWKLPYLGGTDTNPARWTDFSQMTNFYTNLANEFPDKQFVIVTQPLGSQNVYYPGIEQYNLQLRSWWQTEVSFGSVPDNIWWFDIANLESTQADGSTRCLDANQHELICAEWQAPNASAGHLDKNGGHWVAKAFYVLLARIESVLMSGNPLSQVH